MSAFVASFDADFLKGKTHELEPGSHRHGLQGSRPRQEPGSFSLSDVLTKLQEAAPPVCTDTAKNETLSHFSKGPASVSLGRRGF